MMHIIHNTKCYYILAVTLNNTEWCTKNRPAVS